MRPLLLLPSFGANPALQGIIALIFVISILISSLPMTDPAEQLEYYLVGGAVRDQLLGDASTDLFDRTGYLVFSGRGLRRLSRLFQPAGGV